MGDFFKMNIQCHDFIVQQFKPTVRFDILKRAF